MKVFFVSLSAKLTSVSCTWRLPLPETVDWTTPFSAVTVRERLACEELVGPTTSTAATIAPRFVTVIGAMATLFATVAAWSTDAAGRKRLAAIALAGRGVSILGAVWLAWQGLIRKRATRTIEGTLWMVVACVAAIALIGRPATFTGIGTTVSNGVTGVLTPPGDADALAAELEPLMRDPDAAAAMGARARQRVLNQFSLDIEAGRIADVYRTLV